jgi:hypothetical protein
MSFRLSTQKNGLKENSQSQRDRLNKYSPNGPPLIDAVPRTKQTARMSTGGRQPRRMLVQPASLHDLAVKESSEDSEDSKASEARGSRNADKESESSEESEEEESEESEEEESREGRKKKFNKLSESEKMTYLFNELEKNIYELEKTVESRNKKRKRVEESVAKKTPTVVSEDDAKQTSNASDDTVLVTIQKSSSDDYRIVRVTTHIVSWALLKDTQFASRFGRNGMLYLASDMSIPAENVTEEDKGIADLAQTVMECGLLMFDSEDGNTALNDAFIPPTRFLICEIAG